MAPTQTFAASPEGRHPLHWAAAFGDHWRAELLLAVGADVSVRDARGATPLQFARAPGLLQWGGRPRGCWGRRSGGGGSGGGGSGGDDFNEDGGAAGGRWRRRGWRRRGRGRRERGARGRVLTDAWG